MLSKRETSLTSQVEKLQGIHLNTCNSCLYFYFSNNRSQYYMCYFHCICIFIYLTAIAMETVSVQTELMELSTNKQDVSIQFNYLIPSNGKLITM